MRPHNVIFMLATYHCTSDVLASNLSDYQYSNAMREARKAMKRLQESQEDMVEAKNELPI